MELILCECSGENLIFNLFASSYISNKLIHIIRMRCLRISALKLHTIPQRLHTSIALTKKPKFDLKYAPETTLIIKGFLSSGEKVDDYHLWLHSHNRLVHKYRWDELAKGWNWNCGDLEYPIPFITITNFAYSLYKSTKVLKAHPAVIATSFLIDAGYHIGRLIHQYYKVEKNTTILSYQLSQELIRLHKKYKKVRVISHSLGCKLLVNAIKDVPPEFRPHNVHLCAPALDEKTYGPILNEISQRRTYIYYTPKDVVLSLGLKALKGYNPIGSIGLKNEYPNVKLVDVSRYFDDFWIVHNNYNEQFHKFAEDEHETKVYLLNAPKQIKKDE